MIQWLAMICVTMTIEVLTIILLVASSLKLRAYRRQLDKMQEALYREELWLEQKEKKLEKTIERLKLVC